MFASSSPPNVSRVRHGPFSSATTLMPRSVRTLAAAAPDAPAPMMQTDALGGLVLRATRGGLLVFGLLFSEPGECAVATAVDVGQGGGTGKPDRLPARATPVAAVDRVGVEPLTGVQAKQREE